MTRGSTLAALVLSYAAWGYEPAFAAEVKGVVDAPPSAVTGGRTLGYTRTRVAAPSVASTSRRADVAVLLLVETSLPIPVVTEPYKVAIAGLRFSPSVAACVIDQKVAFTNSDRAPITLLIDQKPFAQLAPGETRAWDCATPGLAKVRVKEWPHMRATLFVGELGVAVQPAATGAFSIQAPQGKYELQVLGEEGPIVKRKVEVVKGDVDLGRIVPEGAAAQAAPAPVPADAAKKPAEVAKPDPAKAAEPARPAAAEKPAVDKVVPPAKAPAPEKKLEKKVERIAPKAGPPAEVKPPEPSPVELFEAEQKPKAE